MWPDLISWGIDPVSEEFQDWQKRPLDPVDPVAYPDAIRVRIRDEGTVRHEAVRLAPGVSNDGSKEALVLWIG